MLVKTAFLVEFVALLGMINNMKINTSLFVLSLIFNLLFLGQLNADAPPPTKEITTKLEELFAASKKVNAPGEEKQKARAKIESSLDWDKIAQLCLGAKQAKKNSGKNFEDFRNLLREVVVKTAYTRLDKFWDGNTKYIFQNIEMKGNTAKVPTKFIVKGEPSVLDYYFLKKGNDWLIYDISYEEERYSTNISEQIEAFLKEGNFGTLLDKLRKRKDELTEETAKSKKT